MTTGPSRGAALSSPEAIVPGIAWLAIPTRGRPVLLNRAVASYSSSLARSQQAASILIVEDGAEDNSRAIRLPEGKPPVSYAGPSERRRLTAALLEGRHFPPKVVSFAVLGNGWDGPTIGATRNTILLATAGERVLSVDDDTVCHPSRASLAADDRRLVLGNDEDATEFWFYPDRKAAIRSLQRLALDPVDEHARLLGASVPAAVRAAGPGRVDSTRVSPALQESLARGTGRIRVTLNGVAGDSGLNVNTGLPLHSADGTRRRLTASERCFEWSIHSREVVRQAAATTIFGVTHTMSMFLGLDNGALLPPFVPVYRNGDGLFGLTFRRCCDDAYACQLPWVLLHAPASRRSYRADQLSTVSVVGVLAACIDSWRDGLPSREPAKRMRLLGAHLKDLASLRPDDYAMVHRQLVRRLVSGLIARREAALRSWVDYPAYWASHVRNQIESLLRTASDPHHSIPEEVGLGRSAAEAQSLTQALIGRFGDLLSWWPALIERALELRRGGFEVGRRLK